MNRLFSLIFILFVFASCSAGRKPLAELLPKSAGSVWKLEATQRLGADQAPELVRGLGLRETMQAVYSGNGAITVRVYRMKVEASAFELLQKWPADETVCFYKGELFVTAQTRDLDRVGLSEFMRDLQEAMEAKAP